MSKSREQLNDYLSQIDLEGKVVLDVGVQDKPTSRLCKGTPKKLLTLDIDPQWKPDVVADLNERYVLVDKLNGIMPDVTFCIEVLEHCWDPVRVIKNLSKIVPPWGTLYISTPLINPHHDYVDYMRYTDEWYHKVLPMQGFTHVEIIERRATLGKNLLFAFFTAEGMKISKIRKIDFNSYTYPIGYIVKARKMP